MNLGPLRDFCFFRLLGIHAWLVQYFIGFLLILLGDPVWVRIQPVIQSKIMAGRRTKVAILRKTGVLRAFTLCDI